MTAKKVLIIHTIVFISFLIASLSSPLAAIWYPQVFSGYFLLGVVVLLILVKISWHALGGCPFTVWENSWREREKPGSAYQGSCIKRYMEEWFGVRISPKLIEPALLALFVLPIIIGLLI